MRGMGMNNPFGGYNQGLTSSEDYDLWLRVALHYRFDYVDAPLVKYRTGHASLSQRKRERVRTAQAIIRRFLDEFETDSDYPLTESRRCGSAILSAARAVIESAPDRPERDRARARHHDERAVHRRRHARPREQDREPERVVPSLAENNQKESEPQKPPVEPEEPADVGDISSGADTSETIVREQLENEDKR